ncbi:UNVERIFIED_CONTAM: hypothetical protein FKN15_058203 [Acipenser sinensis]
MDGTLVRTPIRLNCPLEGMPSGREPACTKTLPTVTGLRRQLRATEDTSAATETGSVRPESSTSCSGTYLSPSSASDDDYRWFDELMRSGLKPIKVHSYLQDVLSFLRYLHEADFSHVKLSDRNIRSLMFLLQSFRKQGKRQLLLHRQLVQDHGQERLIPKNKLQCFNQQCETTIPELLDLCESAPSNACTLVGLLCGRLLLHNGHRRGIVMNMSLLDFDSVKAYTGEFHISVSNHKTAGTFGKAVLVVSTLEHQWLLRYAAMRHKLPGCSYKPTMFSFTNKGNPIKKIGRAISKAWKYWGLGDDITTGMIRSAVVTYTWATNNEVNKTAVSRHVAHSLKTQESFYIRDQAPVGHQRARRLIGRAWRLPTACCPWSLTLPPQRNPV